MNNDLEIVHQLLASLNSNQIDKVAHLIANDVVIIDPFATNPTYESYKKHVSIMVQHMEAKLLGLRQVNNVFYAKIDFNILDNTCCHFSDFKAEWAFTIKNELLVKSEIVFEISEVDSNYIQRLIKAFS